jgi:hypothetical protein
MKPVYTCEDYEFKDSVLTIYKPTLVAMVLNAEGFDSVTKTIQYDAIVCPDLFTDWKDNSKANLVIFKK